MQTGEWPLPQKRESLGGSTESFPELSWGQNREWHRCRSRMEVTVSGHQDFCFAGHGFSQRSDRGVEDGAGARLLR